MSNKKMSLNFALDLLYQEATSEESKYSQKQKETAYMLLKDNIYVLKIIQESVLFDDNSFMLLEDHEKEIIQEWLNR